MKFVIARLFSLMSLALIAGGCAGGAAKPVLPPGAKYVALGSSYAAGPGLPPFETAAPRRCTRSIHNYAHQLAARRGLALTDATCSGATSAAVLEPWKDVPAQIDAVDADTRLVTLTIGGNDVSYIGTLMALSCQMTGQSVPPCWSVTWPEEADFVRMEDGLRRIADQVRARAPSALLVFVDYATVLPATGACAATPLPADAVTRSRAIADRLAATTARVATEKEAMLIRAGALSRDHGACADDPWMVGYPAGPGGAPYHPNLAGMSAVATALDAALPR